MVDVKIESAFDVKNENGDSAVMILFTGDVTGKHFEGKVLPGGVDTQIIGKSGCKHTLSARYILEGKDHTGENFSIFIENNGNFGNVPEGIK